jgi:branched-subunit amino acid aminotransferase/4-amino-4-deoxychorismate lyase
VNEMKTLINADVELYALVDTVVHAIQAAEKRTILSGLYEGLPLGVYTAMRTYEHNKFLHLDDHLDRLERSMILLGWEYPLDKSVLRQTLHQVCSNYSRLNARVRIDVLAKTERRIPTGSRVLISLSQFEDIPDHIYRKGVQACVEPALSRLHPEVKKAEFAVIRRKYLEHDPSCYECLIIDANGAILEGTTSNFFAIGDGVLWTAGREVLEGIARKIILKLAGDAQIPVQLDAPRMDDLPSLDESALSSASRGLVPIVQIGDQVIGDGCPGPVTRLLMSSYKDYVADNVRTAV